MQEGLAQGEDGKSRCWWGASPQIYSDYHDQEWGRPTADDRWIFEKLCLEGFQAGLSWLTILKKRENFRKAFANFEVSKVARFGPKDVERLLKDSGIVRHRGKIEASINNAQRALELADEWGSLASYVWQYEPDPATRPAVFSKQALLEITTTPESKAMSKDLKKRGWRFVGPTTMYAFMQSAGIVNDHIEGCVARERCLQERAKFKKPESSVVDYS